MAEYQATTLPSGAILGTACLPDRPVAALGIWTRMGSRYEAASQGGLAHLLEHMVFKGTARRSARRLVMDIEGVGGEVNALTSEDHAVYHAVVPAPHLGRAADVLADLFLHARLDPRDLVKERAVIEEEIQMYRENPGQHVEDLLSEALWPGLPLGRSITGSAETLAGLGVEDLEAWRGLAHAGSNVVAGVASPWSHDQVMKVLGPRLEALPRGRTASAKPVVRHRRRPRVRLDTRPLEQSHAALGFRTPGLHDRRRFALALLSVLLGETMGSRLFQALRERRGLCYTIQSDLDFFDDVGVLAIYTGVEGGRLPAALRALGNELEKVCHRPVGVAELRRAKEFLLGQQAVWMESTHNQMQWVGDCLRSHGRILDPERTRQAVWDVTATQLQAVATDLLVPGHAALAVVGPDDDEAALRDALRWRT